MKARSDEDKTGTRPKEVEFPCAYRKVSRFFRDFGKRSEKSLRTDSPGGMSTLFVGTSPGFKLRHFFFL